MWTIDEASISDRLKSAGYRHARDAFSGTDYRHSVFSNGGFIGRFDAAEAIDLLEGKRGPRRGRDLYEADVIARPLYGDGTPRKTWDELDAIARESWTRQSRGEVQS